MPRSRQIMVDPRGFKEMMAQIRGRKTDLGASAQLREELETVLAIEDKGEKLMALTALNEKREEAAKDTQRKYRYLGDAGMLGVFAFLFGLAGVIGVAAAVAPVALAAFNPPFYVMIGMVALEFAPMVVVSKLHKRFVGEDVAVKAYSALQTDIAQKTEELVKNTPPLEFASSTAFDAVMGKFADLKERFLLASGRDSALKNVCVNTLSTATPKDTLALPKAAA